MTAGRGIVHSEKASETVLAAGQRLHGIQTWVALPLGQEDVEPRFEHYAAEQIPEVRLQGGRARVIIGEADRLRNLVNRMLGPNNVPVKQPVNIHQILEHVRSLVGAENYTDLVIEREYDPSIPDLMADPDLLVQAFLNLVRNAAEAGADRIVLRTRTERQFTIGHNRYKLVLRVDIIDNGPGIPAELQERIFYPMVTGRAEGTGLGLSIAQSLINQHQGIIEFTSARGNTVFTIFLPLEVMNG